MAIETVKCNGLRQLLSATPLYKKVLVNSEIAEDPRKLYDFGFPFICLCNTDPQTHLLKLDEKTIQKMANHGLMSFEPGGRHERYGEYMLGSEIGQRFFETATGECQNCKRVNPIFLIEFFTEKDKKGEHFLFAKKIGQTPPFSIKIDGYIRKSFNAVNLDLYQKALMNLSSNYGIGAFAYFRRIVETELLSLLVQVSKLDTPESDQINFLLEKHNSNHVISDLLEEVYKFLPESLKGLGDNPFKLLYGTTSVGIHQLTDDECFNKAVSVKYVLEFVLKKIYEEKNEVSLVRNHIKNLK